MKAIFILTVLLGLTAPVFGADKTIHGETRDPSGKLLYKTNTRGNVTETRDPSGKLVIKSTTRNGTTETRSPSGKLLYKTR